MKKVIYCLLVLIESAGFTKICSGQGPAKKFNAEFTLLFTGDEGRDLNILGKYNGKPYGLMTSKDKSGDDRNFWFCIEDATGKTIRKEGFVFPVLKDIFPKSNIRLLKTAVLKGRIMVFLGYESVTNMKRNISVFSVDPETLSPVESEAALLITLDEMKIAYATINPLDEVIISVSSDSTLFTITDPKYNMPGKKKMIEMNIHVYDAITSEKISSDALFTDVPDWNFSIGKIDVINKNRVVAVLNRDIDLVDPSTNKSGSDIETQIIYSGEAGKNNFQRLGRKQFKALRMILGQSIIASGENLQVITMFRDTIKEGKKTKMFVPGIEIVQVNAATLQEAPYMVLRATPTQTSMCLPNKDNIVKNSTGLDLATRFCHISEIEKTASGRLIIVATAEYSVGSNSHSDFVLIASFDPKNEKESWLRVLPKAQHWNVTTGFYHSLHISKEDVFICFNDILINTQYLTDVNSIINDGDKNADGFPEPIDKVHYKEYSHNQDNFMVRLDHINKQGVVKTHYVDKFPGEGEYLPTPGVSWVENDGYLYVLGLHDYESNNRYKSFDFIKFDLNKIASD